MSRVRPLDPDSPSGRAASEAYAEILAALQFAVLRRRADRSRSSASLAHQANAA